MAARVSGSTGSALVAVAAPWGLFLTFCCRHRTQPQRAMSLPHGSSGPGPSAALRGLAALGLHPRQASVQVPAAALPRHATVISPSLGFLLCLVGDFVRIKHVNAFRGA